MYAFQLRGTCYFQFGRMLDKQIKPRTMKLLFVFESLQTNGATKSLVALLNAVCEDYDISLFLFKRDKVAEQELSEDIVLLDEDAFYASLVEQMKMSVGAALRSGNFRLGWFRFRVFLERMLRRPFAQWNKLKAINGVYDIAIAYSDGFASEVVCNKVAAAKKILWLHVNPLLDALPKKSLDAMLKADCIAGVSNDAICNLRKVVSPCSLKLTRVVHNIVDSVKIAKLADAEKIELPGDGFKILSVGRITKEKGYSTIPAILNALKADGIACHWFIVGDGANELKECILADAERRGVADRLCFLGCRLNPYPYFRAADCYVQTSITEGWGLAISEALSLGKPVVCTNLPVFAEQVKDGENGYLAEWTPQAFYEKIKMVLQGGMERPLSENAAIICSPKNVRNEFSGLIHRL